MRQGDVGDSLFVFGDACIEDQWIPFFCVSCNLTRGEVVVHRSGPFRECIRTSSALPGLWPPVFRNHELLVDGGVMNNLPADVMRDPYGGRVIAVDVTPRHELKAEFRHKDVLSGWEALRRRMRVAGNPGEPDGLNLFSILTRTVMPGSVLAADDVKKQVGWYLHPPVGDVETFDWSAIDRAVERGYRYTREQLEAGAFTLDDARA